MEKRFYHIALPLFILGLLLIGSLVEVFGSAYSPAGNYERTYTFDVQYGYCRFSHKLYTSTAPSLYDYYHSKSHSIRGDGDYAKFVTPGAFKSIAGNIKNVTGNLPYSEEQFANAVLMLVRQVPYVESNVKYPVETMLENSGDCDLLSLLAASIMKAGGLDVVLLYYKNLSPGHMNIGVYLPYTPVYRTWWLAPAGFEYNNKTYWMAECTSRGGWKVGDRPDLLADVKPQIIPLENCEEASPAHVASSLAGSLVPSAISITVSSENASIEDSGRMLTVSGSISPARAGKTVVMYVGKYGNSYNDFRTVFTDEFGNYSFTWNFTSTGAYYVRTSLSGFSNYSSSDSEELAVFTGFYRPSVPTEAEYYWSALSNDALARANVAPLYAFSVIQRSKELLQLNLTGASVSLSGEFIIMQNEQNATTQGNEQTITLARSRRYAAVQLLEQEQQPKNWFGFILQSNSENNCTASVKVLNSDAATRLTAQLAEDGTAFMNASMSTRENTWYKVSVKMSEGVKTAELYDANGALLQNITEAGSVLGVSESGLLVAYEPDAVVVFRNLKAETFDQPAPSADEGSVDEFAALAFCIGLTVLLAVAAAAVTYVKERNRVFLRGL